MTRLLYLGFAFPPGMQALHLDLNPAGHALETQMVAALRGHLEIRSVGVLPIPAESVPGADPASGVAHELVLLEKAPELLHRWRSLQALKRQYLRWQAEGWSPDAVLVYAFSPIYNNFIRWLCGQPARPRLILLLADSSALGQALPALKRLRYRLKPLVIPESEMIGEYDAGIGLSQSTEKYFRQAGRPFLWMPGGCTPKRARAATLRTAGGDGPIRFGYFGALAAHAGALPLVETFLAGNLPNELHLCGYGRLAGQVAEMAGRDSRLKYHGLLSPDDCLRFAENCDVLVNPRPASHGNENNFPSKVFDYALCARAILTTRMAGVDTVLGPEASYVAPARLDTELARELETLARVPRSELRRRGAAIRDRVTSEYAWPRQAERMAQFIVAANLAKAKRS